VPVWHEKTLELQRAGKLQIVGLIQEQHPDRCRLFMQWKKMGWPILVDSLNRTGVYAVPLFWAIDEHGVLRSTRPSLEWVKGEFLSTDYPEPPKKKAAEAHPIPDAEVAFLEGQWSEAIDQYNKADYSGKETTRRRGSGSVVPTRRVAISSRGRRVGH